VSEADLLLWGEVLPHPPLTHLISKDLAADLGSPCHVAPRLRTQPQMPKTNFLQVRLTPDDRERLERVAEAEHLDASTWARRVLLQAIERWEEKRRKKGA
jgi:hypothetical protein